MPGWARHGLHGLGRGRAVGYCLGGCWGRGFGGSPGEGLRGRGATIRNGLTSKGAEVGRSRGVSEPSAAESLKSYAFSLETNMR